MNVRTSCVPYLQLYCFLLIPGSLSYTGSAAAVCVDLGDSMALQELTRDQRHSVSMCNFAGGSAIKELFDVPTKWTSL